MKTKDTPHKHQLLGIDEPVFPKIDLTYERSKDDVWQSLTLAMEKSNVTALPPKRHMNQVWVRISVAAILVVGLGLGSFSRLYTKTIHSATGEHYLAMLPDGSTAEMNAGSILKYKPFWWYFNREVEFEGEAFFKVRKGEKFEVVSHLGRTSVLGTSFNIYARKGNYTVTCYTGKVRVVSIENGHSLDIEPREQASINRDGTMKLSQVEMVSEEAPWMNDMFFFTATPISLVFEEIERQYGITIDTHDLNKSLLYTGNFTRSLAADEVLKMVCRPYGLGFQIIDGVYVVQKE
jgi:ferric-dicitrate binding protein FerR (iron transport regulator)